MKNNYFGEKARRAKSSERGEAMPAAIVTAIISSLLLLGIASVVSLVVQNKADSEGGMALTTAASNIDVSLRSDITQASYISAAAKLKQPTARTLGPTDVNLSGVNMHIPTSSGECKVIRWNINGNNASRDLTIYQSSLKDETAVKCNETSEVVGQRTKVFAQNVNVDAPIVFKNQVGNEIAFTVDTAALDKVNAELEKQLTAKGVQKLSESDFNELNKLMGTDSYVPGFKNPSACVMDAARVWVDTNKDGVKQDPAEMVCPPAEADTVAAAWNSRRISNINVSVQMASNSGEVAKRDIAQNSSVPLYADAAEAEAAVAGSSADSRPAAPVVTLSTANVTLGANYTINWTDANGACPTSMVRSFKIYENNVLVRTQATLGYTKNYTNSATEFLNYTVQIECVRGALVVSSDMSAVATAKVIPAVPALVINTQPAATNAALNSTLTSTANCLYGTTPRYNIVQAVTSYGTPNTTVSNVTIINRAINNGFTVVEGARYQYRVEAWCISSFDKSPQTAATTNPFVTVINGPSAGPFVVSPSNGATNVATDIAVIWNPVTCATGTTTKYFSAKNVDAGVAIAQQIITNWTGNTGFLSNNTEGSTVGYIVMARCEGTVAISNPSPATNVQYTTLINTPVGPMFTSPTNNATDVATSKVMQWSYVNCAAGTTTTYYTTKNMDSGASITPQVMDNWTTNLSFVANNTEGNNVGYTVAARCEGPNANSASTATDSVRFTTLISAPAMPNFVSPAQNAMNVSPSETITWDAVTCGAGASTMYYVTKNIAGGASIAPIVLADWTNATSVVSANDEGSTVGYTVAARCEGMSIVSAPSATSALSYTTVINAPSQPVFTSPAAAATNVATNATVSWSDAICGPGASPKYYTTKNLDRGASITPIVIDSWNTDTTYVSANKQGYTVGYTVAARCEGANATSGASANSALTYTTLVNAPSAVTASNNGLNSVSWVAPATKCAAEAPIGYRIYHIKSDNNIVNSTASWTTGLTAVLPRANTGGYPQWASVQAYCNGANADSTVTAGANITKWVKLFDVSFSATQPWRRVNVWGNCPISTTIDSFNLYVAADGWGGRRGFYGATTTDEGASIASAEDGPGGNTGWMNLMQNVNPQWNDTIASGTTYNWGYNGASGLGAAYSSRAVSATYWNASAWGNWGYWWTGSCETPYMIVYDKGTVRFPVNGTIANAGSPGTRYTPYPTSASLTTAGVNSIQ